MEKFTGYSIVDILKAEGNWDAFRRLYNKRIRPVVIANINRTMACKGSDSYFTFVCKDCGHMEQRPRLCHSKFCTRCGTIAMENWFDKLTSRLPLHLKYIHIIFTLPEEFRDCLMMFREVGILDMIFRVIHETILTVFDEKYHCFPGIFSTIHTFGDDLKWNPHIHVLVTAGGISEDHDKRISISEQTYISYIYVNTVYKAVLVKRIKEFISKLSPDEQQLPYVKKVLYTIKTQLYKNNPKQKDKSLYVKICEGQRDVSATFSYTARYVRKPPISQARIKSFYQNIVTFQYFDKYDSKHKLVRLPALEFIERLIVHVPDHGFKTTRYAGMFASRKKKYFLDCIKKLVPVTDELYEKHKLTIETYKRTIFSYKEKLIKYFGKDPRCCPKCGGDMQLQSITLKLTHKTITRIITRHTPP